MDSASSVCIIINLDDMFLGSHVIVGRRPVVSGIPLHTISVVVTSWYSRSFHKMCLSIRVTSHEKPYVVTWVHTIQWLQYVHTSTSLMWLNKTINQSRLRLGKFINAQWHDASDTVELKRVSAMKTQMLSAWAILVILVAGTATLPLASNWWR